MLCISYTVETANNVQFPWNIGRVIGGVVLQRANMVAAKKVVFLNTEVAVLCALLHLDRRRE